MKVYRLNEDGKWDDQGTGHVTVDYLEVCSNPFSDQYLSVFSIDILDLVFKNKLLVKNVFFLLNECQCYNSEIGRAGFVCF